MRDDQLVSPRQIMDELGVAYQTVRNWVKRGKLTPVSFTLGGHARYARTDVEAIKSSREGRKAPVIADPRLEQMTKAVEAAVQWTSSLVCADSGYEGATPIEQAKLAAAYGYGLIQHLEHFLDEQVLKQVGIHRVELFFRVWNAPLAQVAMRLGAKKHLVVKLCKENGVPFPPPGYWQTSIDRRPFIINPIRQ